MARPHGPPSAPTTPARLSRTVLSPAEALRSAPTPACTSPGSAPMALPKAAMRSESRTTVVSASTAICAGWGRLANAEATAPTTVTIGDSTCASAARAPDRIGENAPARSAAVPTSGATASSSRSSSRRSSGDDAATAISPAASGLARPASLSRPGMSLSIMALPAVEAAAATPASTGPASRSRSTHGTRSACLIRSASVCSRSDTLLNAGSASVRMAPTAGRRAASTARSTSARSLPHSTSAPPPRGSMNGSAMTEPMSRVAPAIRSNAPTHVVRTFSAAPPNRSDICAVSVSRNVTASSAPEEMSSRIWAADRPSAAPSSAAASIPRVPSWFSVSAVTRPVDCTWARTRTISRMSTALPPAAATASWTADRVGTIRSAAMPNASRVCCASIHTCRGNGEVRANSRSRSICALAASADPSRVVNAALLVCSSVLYAAPVLIVEMVHAAMPAAATPAAAASA